MNRSLEEELTGMWGMLAKKPATSLSAGKLSIKIGKRNFSAAIDGVGSRHLLVPVPEGADQARLWKAAAVRLSRANLRGDDKVRRTWLDLQCTRSELEGVFVRMAAAVAQQLLSVEEDEVQATCIAALDEWRDLLGYGHASEGAVTGLVGELLLLEQLAKIDPIKALDVWVGPRGGRHDFRRGNHAIEVKATVTRIGKIVEIHGVQQMVAPVQGDLHLAFFRLERVPGGSESIANILKRLVGLGVPTEDLMELLEVHGIENLGQAPAKAGFEKLEQSVFSVSDMFPRIVPGSFLVGGLPADVLDVSYRIDLSQQTALDHDASSLVVAKLVESLE